MFRGQFTHSVDAKGRVSVPVRFREQLLQHGDTRCIITKAFTDKCLHLYPMRVWERFEQRVAEEPRFDQAMVLFRRKYVSPAKDCELDRVGRLLIPPELRSQVALEQETEAVWAGMGDHVELWQKDNFEASLEVTPELEARVQSLLEQIKL